MATTVCPYCHARAHMTARWASNAREQLADGGSRMIGEGVLLCDNCGRASLAILPANTNIDANSITSQIDQSPSNTRWVPRVGEVREFLDVPEPIASTASEAFECSSINANRAAILLARTTIEATAKAKGITSGSLVQKINGLRDANLIRPDVADAAHEVRLLGNDMAHGDNLEAVATEEAEEILELMADVLEEVFQAPARLAARRARRAAATS